MSTNYLSVRELACQVNQVLVARLLFRLSLYRRVFSWFAGQYRHALKAEPRWLPGCRKAQAAGSNATASLYVPAPIAKLLNRCDAEWTALTNLPAPTDITGIQAAAVAAGVNREELRRLSDDDLATIIAAWALAVGRNKSADKQEIDSASAGRGERAKFIFCRDGDGWFVRGFGQEGHFQDKVGFQYIARLLAAPRGEVWMIDLVGAEKIGALPGGDAMLDREAIEDYKKRLSEIEAELEKARRANDLALLDRLLKDKAVIEKELITALGLRGKGRKLGDSRDTLRSRVAMALQRCYEALRKAGLNKLATHFEGAVSTTGPLCCYRPGERPDWR